jgi:phage terminase small subunit
MAKKLSKKQKNFCKFKAQGFSNEESAVRAGYAKISAKANSHKFMENPLILNELERLSAKVEKIADEKFEITIESVLKDIVDIKNNCKDAKPDVALKACDMLGKHIGIYEKDNEQKAPKLPDIHISGV